MKSDIVFNMSITLLTLCSSVLGFMYAYRFMSNYQMNEMRAEANNKIKKHPHFKELEKHTFDEYELQILDGLIDPKDISTSFKDIGGLDDTIQELRDSIFLPLEYNLQNSSLIQIPKGILLYGPPGTGKTSLAKAIAKESGYYFLSINDSIIESKFYGETQKLINAVFTIAQKLQPAIIFIDEIDSIASARDLVTSELNQSKKSMLLQLWDGVKDSKVVIIGATNREETIDEAFLRRMPKKIKIGLPNLQAREQILKIQLGNHNSPDFDFKLMARKTKGFSGSDIKELKNESANVAFKNFIKNQNQEKKTKIDADNIKITTEDMDSVLYRFVNRGFRKDSIDGKEVEEEYDVEND